MTGILICALAVIPEVAAQEQQPTVLSLEDAIRIALSENISVKVADKEIERTGYAKKGSYAALFPNIDLNGTYQRTIKKQMMYMDVPVAGLGDGLEVGRWNTWSAGASASMPIVNVQLWKSIKISGMDVELAVEKARSSRIETVTQVKQTYFSVLLAKEAFNVYRKVYENAVDNLEQTQRKYNAQRASELDLARAKTNVANAVPDVYDAENSIALCLWQLKAVIGMDLDTPVDVQGALADYSEHMFYDIHQHDTISLDKNSSMRQLAIQADELAEAVRLQKAAYYPSLSLGFNFSLNAMTNDFKFNEYKWSPYSYVGLSLNIPIFSGGKRRNQVRQAQVQATELDLQRINTERQLKIAIRQSLNSMETAMKSYVSAQSAVESAQKAYNIASSSYEVGRSTLTDLNVAQLSLTQAQLSVAQAIFSFVSGKAALEGTLGFDLTDTNNE